MKQTSQAIALLIASASAAATSNINTTGYQTGSAKWQANLTPTGTTTAAATQSRTAPYKFVTSTPAFTWTTAVPKASILAATYTGASASGFEITDTNIVSGGVAGSTCMNCIGGGGVWCSRTYNFAIANVYTYQAANLLWAAGINAASGTQAASWTATTATDQGSCCDTKANFVTYIGATASAATAGVWASATGNAAISAGVSAAGSQATGGSYPNKATCVAVKSAMAGAGSDGAWAQGSFDDTTTLFSSWWCSNGLYKTVTNVSAADYTTNIIQTMSASDNSRTELALVGCPMILGKCGGTTGVTTPITGVTTLTASQISTATPVTILVPKNQGTDTGGESVLTKNDKCTWVATSTTYAPTFSMSNGGTSTTGALGLVANNWQIHHMEYIINASSVSAFSANNGVLVQSATDTTGAQQVGEAVAYGNYVPKFIMPADQFATLRTWYSTGKNQTGNLVGGSSGSVYNIQPTAWFNVYQNAAPIDATNNGYYAAMTTTQQFGNVSNMPYSSIAQNTAAGANLTAGQNYGQNLTAYFDFRTVRYMPASSAQNVWAAGSALNTSYTAATTSYATAKTTWNAYVAILKKNAKMDAFAAAFSPPKAPTVPPLPNMPWTPAAYSGYQRQTNLQNMVMSANSIQTAAFVSASQPTAGQFWTSLDAAQTIGGWGSFTASIIQFRDGWGKSFGTIGYGPGTQTMSQVLNSSMMCGTAAAVTAVASTNACENNYTYSANATTMVAIAAAVNTNFTFVTVVSLWSAGNTEAASGVTGVWAAKQSFAITWTSGNWSNTLQSLNSITQPGTPTAADSLTGVAGASALAASSAAVLAIAALY